MPMKKIDVEFTEAAIERFKEFLSGITDYEPTLVLTKGRWQHEADEHWRYGAYGPDNLEFLEPGFDKLGHSLLYEINGLTVAISQPDKINELLGKTIDIGDSYLIVNERSNGI